MIVIPTPQDCMRYSTEPNYFEPIYPLFYITSSIISGNWNSLSDIYGFYHVFTVDTFFNRMLSFLFLIISIQQDNN